jgi:phospholipid transport system substrate-binding protein
LKNSFILSGALITTLIPAAAFSYDFRTAPYEAPATPFITVSANDISTKAHDFIKNLADKGIGFLADKKLTPEKRKEQFRALLKDNFDMKTIARFSLGPYWKTCTDAQRKEYLKLFEHMIVEVYSRRFSDYEGQKLNILKARPEGDRDAIVASAIVPASGPEIKVDWRVREKSGTFQVVDIMVEGVSMSLTQRADFASVIQRGGGNVETLLEHLRVH